MKKQEYTDTQKLLLMQAQAISNFPFDLDEFIRAIEKVDSLGPVMDPSLWQKGHKQMDQIKIIAKAVQQARQDIIPALGKLKQFKKRNSK